MAITTKSPARALVIVLVALVALLALAGPASASSSVGGKTTLALDPGTAGALTSLGISVAPIGPATAGDEGVSFPITGAALRWRPLSATIDHSGGLALSSATTTVSLTDYTINLGRHPGLVATVNGGPRVKILSLDLSHASIAFRWRKIVLRNVKANLTADAAGALNAAFGTSALQAGLPLGVVTVKLRLR